MNRPNLPDFQTPPVIEVALAVQFAALQDLRAIHLGALWDAFDRSQFPTAEEQPPIPANIERAGVPRVDAAPQFEILNIPPLPRYLFISSSGTEVLQVQHDRFAFNWRKGLANEEYPRFEALLAKFELHLQTLIQFLTEKKLGAISATQVELTYVNEIKAEMHPGKLERVVSVFSGEYSDEGLGDPEETRLLLRYPIRVEGEFVGRLHVEVRPSTSSDTQAGINLVLAARGRPLSTGIKGVVEFLLLARVSIVSAFASITSKEMHKTWGRTDNA